MWLHQICVYTKDFYLPLVDGIMALGVEETPNGARNEASNTRAPI